MCGRRTLGDEEGGGWTGPLEATTPKCPLVEEVDGLGPTEPERVRPLSCGERYKNMNSDQLLHSISLATNYQNSYHTTQCLQSL